MTDTTNKASLKAIDYFAHAVNVRGRKRYFTPIGVCFKHKKGPGLTIMLNAHPIGDEIVLFAPTEKPE